MRKKVRVQRNADWRLKLVVLAVHDNCLFSAPQVVLRHSGQLFCPRPTGGVAKQALFLSRNPNESRRVEVFSAFFSQSARVLGRCRSSSPLGSTPLHAPHAVRPVKWTGVLTALHCGRKAFSFPVEYLLRGATRGCRWFWANTAV